MKKLTLDEVKRIQVEILVELHRFCEDNGIRYFIGGGTLIGAVRHRGYIPWDDDIDVAMLRPEYERFLKAYNAQDKAHRVYSVNHCTWWPFPFAKLCRKNTRMIETNVNFGKHEIGVNIDVFPIDDCPDDPAGQQRLIRRKTWRRAVIDLKSPVISGKRSLIKNAVLVLSKGLFYFVSPYRMSVKINQLSQKHNGKGTDHCGVIVWGHGLGEIVHKQVFSGTVEVEFENRRFLAPVGYHEWLTSIFGDYMTLPPKEKQVSLHDFEAFQDE